MTRSPKVGEDVSSGFFRKRCSPIPHALHHQGAFTHSTHFGLFRLKRPPNCGNSVCDRLQYRILAVASCVFFAFAWWPLPQWDNATTRRRTSIRVASLSSASHSLGYSIHSDATTTRCTTPLWGFVSVQIESYGMGGLISS